MYTQQHVQARDHKVYQSHLYVHMHWNFLFYVHGVQTFCAAYFLLYLP